MTYPTTTTTLFRSSMPRSKNLVIVNKGPDAALLCREGGNWDLMEIYFSPADIEKITRDPSLTDAEHIVFETERKKRKFAIIKTIFEATDFWHYEAIMMADDDLIPVGCTIAEMFDLFATTGCRIGQPALTHDSFFAHPITIKNNAYIWRRTNFVEVMCPIMTNEAIREYIAIFDATSGFGLDNCWSYHECRKGIGTAILDRTPMRHHRPVEERNHKTLFPPDEAEKFLAKYKIPQYTHLNLGGICDETNVAERVRRSITCFDPQKIVDEFWYSTSWRATRWLRNLIRRLRGRPLETRPLVSTFDAANLVVSDIRRSTFWELLGPARVCVNLTKKQWRR